MSHSIEEIIRDIPFAQSALTEAGLSLAANDQLICEVYRQPAHNRSTLYAKVYVKNGMVYAQYARPELFRLGSEIHMCSFERVAKAMGHGGSKAHILCSMRRIDSLNSLDIQKRLQEMSGVCLPQKGIVIDDDAYFVRHQQNSFLFCSSHLRQEFKGKETVEFFKRLTDTAAGETAFSESNYLREQ